MLQDLVLCLLVLRLTLAFPLHILVAPGGKLIQHLQVDLILHDLRNDLVMEEGNLPFVLLKALGEVFEVAYL